MKVYCRGKGLTCAAKNTRSTRERKVSGKSTDGISEVKSEDAKQRKLNSRVYERASFIYKRGGIQRFFFGIFFFDWIIICALAVAFSGYFFFLLKIILHCKVALKAVCHAVTLVLYFEKYCHAVMSDITPNGLFYHAFVRLRRTS